MFYANKGTPAARKRAAETTGRGRKKRPPSAALGAPPAPLAIPGQGLPAAVPAPGPAPPVIADQGLPGPAPAPVPAPGPAPPVIPGQGLPGPAPVPAPGPAPPVIPGQGLPGPAPAPAPAAPVAGVQAVAQAVAPAAQQQIRSRIQLERQLMEAQLYFFEHRAPNILDNINRLVDEIRQDMQQ